MFRRYNCLKKTIRHTVMYLKLDVLPDVTHALGGTGSLLLLTSNGSRRPPMSKSSRSMCRTFAGVEQAFDCVERLWSGNLILVKIESSTAKL